MKLKRIMWALLTKYIYLEILDGQDQNQCEPRDREKILLTIKNSINFFKRKRILFSQLYLQQNHIHHLEVYQVNETNHFHD